MWERVQVGEVIVVSGPPGSGKSTVAKLLSERYDPSALVVGDAFFSFLARGAIDPWLPEADAQNRVVLDAAAAACGRLSEGCTVVYDGVLWPPYLWEFTKMVGRPIHDAVLLPPLEVCLERVRTRADHPFSDEAAATHMWRSFDAKRGSLHTLDTAGSPADVAGDITTLVASGTILQT
jgi:predicted kinase